MAQFTSTFLTKDEFRAILKSNNLKPKFQNDNKHFSSWRVYFDVKCNDGCYHTMWFSIHKGSDEIKFIFEYIWKGGEGVKMRKDGGLNVLRKLSKNK
jgi:hypothetical protein